MKQSVILAFGTMLLASLVLGACDSNLDKVRTSPGVTSVIGAGKVPTAPALDITAVPSATPVYSPAVTRKPGAVLIRVDQSRILNPISPLIYGLAGSDEANPNYNKELNVGLNRWGGNPSTRYNWVYGNAWNAARDFQFRNGNYDNLATGGQPRYVFAEAVQAAKEQKIPFLLTIPTIGWLAKNDNSKLASLNVPDKGGAPLFVGAEAIKGYDPTANRQLTSVPSKARKNAPFVLNPDPNSPIIYQDEWVNYLVKKFGTAEQGGVQFYAMDNEPDLWSITHTDIHPVQTSYDEVRDRFLEYANAVKEVDPTAKVTGPVVSGWTFYFYSELDRGNDNFRTALDRKAHDDQPFLAWFLQQVRAADEKNGRRSLDVLDVHFYPQGAGVYEDKTDAATNALRLRSTRALWDKGYTDESWIKQPVALIPLMQGWINSFYPGTKLGITEWNWGADTTLNGALAIANVLGIFGRDGVYMAAYWRFPPANSPGFYAFKMFTNFDNNGSNFGDQAVAAQSFDYQNVSSFAALDTKTNRMRIMLINNQPDKERDLEIELAKSLNPQTAKIYELSARTANKIVAQPDLAVSGSLIELKLPAYSIVMLDIQL